jgi:all-trans-retinol 13,14-reductase
MRFPWQLPPPPPPTPPPFLSLFKEAIDVTPFHVLALLPAFCFTILLMLLTYEAIFFKTVRPAAKRSKGLGHQQYSAEKLPEGGIDTIIIGSGMGGLSCGAVLSQFGERVLVLEQHEVTGGGAHEFAVEGKKRWVFASGHHITIPWHEQVLQLACGTPRPPVPFGKLCDPLHGGVSDRVALSGAPADEAPLPIMSDTQLAEELRMRFPAHKDSLRRYFAIAEKVQMLFGLLTVAGIFPAKVRALLLRTPLMAHWRKWAGMSSAEGLKRIFPGADRATKRLVSYVTGLWIDQGSPSSRASFFMQSSVFGGWQKLGVSYPHGGPQQTALAMVEAIEQRGGRVFVRCPVHAVVRDPESGAATGVVLASGERLVACTIVSALGYRSTEALLRQPVPRADGALLPPLPLPPAPPSKPLATKQSLGFVMANVALKGTAAELGISESSLWVQPAHEGNDFDALVGESAYLADPLGVPVEGIPVGITFPTLKEHAGARRAGKPPPEESGYHTCQILSPADMGWFVKHRIEPDCSEWRPLPGSRHAPPHVTRADPGVYAADKKQWAERLTAILHRYYPGTIGRTEFVDVSTPLTIEHYLRSDGGAAIGLDVTPARFVDGDELTELDMRHPRVRNFWRCGQDYLMAGQVLAAASGILCALRMRGVVAACRFGCRALLLLLGRWSA